MAKEETERTKEKTQTDARYVERKKKSKVTK
jgi:hypothetical protein